MKFRAIIELAGKTATGIEVPAAVVTKLGSSKKPAVRVTIKGYTYRGPRALSSVRPRASRITMGTGIISRYQNTSADEHPTPMSVRRSRTAPRQVVE